jgi:dipeptidase
MYCGITRVPEAFAVGNGDMLHYSPTAAFWVFNWVTHWVYSRWNPMIRDLQTVQRELEKRYVAMTPAVDKAALELYNMDPDLAREYLTTYSAATGNYTVERWKELGEYLLVKYIDGNIKKEKDGKFETNPHGVPVSPSQPGYPEWWLKEIVREHGDVIRQVGKSGH